MVVATSASVSQADTVILSEGTVASLKLSQAGSVAVYNIPSVNAKIPQTGLVVVAEGGPTLSMSQAQVVVVYRGRVANHKLRVWTFSLDGHDFYVITLGEDITLVYDLTTDQWAEWSTEDYDTWRAHKGTNWISMGSATYSTQAAQSNVVAGDDNFGLLWTLNPEVGYDEDPVSGDTQFFTRKLIAGQQQGIMETRQIAGVYAVASMGSPQISGGSITLRTSDDLGKTWDDQGTITVTALDYIQEFTWRSLGLLKYPGKLFEITDNGGTVRIDSVNFR